MTLPDELVESRMLSEARQRVIRRLPPQRHEVREFDVIPFFALVADARTFEVLLSDPDVVSIQEDFQLRTHLAQSVPLVQATQAWAAGFTGKGRTVAILDTGVEKKHTDFGGRVVGEACYSGGGVKTDSYCKSGALSREEVGADDQIRTGDLLITNQLLYQLSYVGFGDEHKIITRP